MVSPSDLAARKHEVCKAAARRYRDRAPRVAETAERLQRGGSVAAATPERAERFRLREAAKRRMRPGVLGFERIIGDTVDLEESPPTVSARRAGVPVARIVELVDRHRVGEGFATGFMAGSGLLFTNWHVFSRAGEAAGCAAQFGYEINDSGLLDAGTVFELSPATFFLSDEALDIALVAVKPAAAIGSRSLAEYERVRLIPELGKILPGHPVSIIQHPDGRHKHWAVRQNKLLLEPGDADLFLQYATDTLPGSSGSPAFNHDWELVAIHHSGVPRMVDGEIVTRTGRVWMPGMPDSDIDWVANEGARVSKVHAFLKAQQMPDPAQQALLDALLSESTDPVVIREGLVAAADARGGSSSSVSTEGHAMQVVVHGTANFYIGSGATASVGVAPAPAVGPAALPVPAPGVGVEKKLRFDADYPNRPGYQDGFLPGFTVPTPRAPLDEVIRHGNGQKILRYHHYSLVMHKARRFCMWAASNVNYDPGKRWRSRKQFGTDTWKPDPRIAGEFQIDDVELYDPAKKFDQGHIVRRDDVAWGNTMDEEEFGNSDSFHFTNCTPQHEEFNRAVFQFKGLWGELENHIGTQAGFLQNRLIVFAGPVLADDDPTRDFGLGADIQIPIAFWKVVIAVEDPDQAPSLRAYGFILSQQEAIDVHGWENRFNAGKFTEQQVALAMITERARVTFPQIVLDADPLAGDPNESRGRRLSSLEDVRLR